MFSHASHYQFIISREVKCESASAPWNTSTPLKIKYFLQHSQKKMLNTRNFIGYMIGKYLEGCLLCNYLIKIVDHLQFLSSYLETFLSIAGCFSKSQYLRNLYSVQGKKFKINSSTSDVDRRLDMIMPKGEELKHFFE